jgi:hypothetical protein
LTAWRLRAKIRPPHHHRVPETPSMIEASIVITLLVVFTFVRWVTR